MTEKLKPYLPADRKQNLKAKKPSKKQTKKTNPVVPAAVADIAISAESNPKDNSKKGKPSKTSSGEPQTMEELLTQSGYQLKGIKRGDFVEGIITYIGPKSLLIDVGAKTEGVLHEKEWKSVSDLISTLKVGDKVTCYVVLPENDKGQVVLSLKKTAFLYKWDKVEGFKKTGEVISVRGKEVNKGGLICEMDGGLMGFLPSSQMGASYYGKAYDMVNKVVQVKIIEVDPKQNRLIFSQREVVGLERRGAIEDLLKKIKVGQTYEGKITGIVPYGAFAEIEGLAGLIHISEISWERVDNVADFFKVTDKVKIVILGIDEKTGKLNLSVKQLTADPWDKVEEKYEVNKTIKGKISRISPYGAFVYLEPGVEGLIHISKIPPEKELIEGQEVDCTIESIEKKKRRIALVLIMTEKPMGYR